MSKSVPVKVALRCRPLNSKEADQPECLQFINEANQVIVNKSKGFTYDYIFDTKSNQKQVYDKAVLPLISRIFKGYNGTVLAYGQTGSGKTYTMGSAYSKKSENDEFIDDSTGVIPRAVKDIFKGIEQRSQEYEFVVKVWYAEIYMEEVKDLLAEDQSKANNLNIREFIDGAIKIAGITEVVVSTPESTLQLMDTGNCNRAVGCTAMNKTSSRSHAIFTMVMESKELKNPDNYTHSKFQLVDLAGSERAKRTMAEGDRLKEGIKINSGLLTLGNVISALGDGVPHIPYRDSKLTRLLQNSLGGNAMTVMIACTSPAMNSQEETLNTLKYADRARKIKNKAVVNLDPQTAEMARLRQENQALKKQLLAGGNQLPTMDDNSPEDKKQVGRNSHLHEENKKLKEELADVKLKNQDLLEQADLLIRNNCSNLEKVIKLEEERTVVKQAVYSIQEQARNVCDITIPLNELTQLAGEDVEMKEQITKLFNLRSTVLKVKVEDTDLTTEIDTLLVDKSLDNSDENENNNSGNKELLNMTEDEKHVHLKRSHDMQIQLEELSKAISMKEQMVTKMGNSEEIKELKVKYENHVKSLDEQILKLEREKQNLQIKIDAGAKSKNKKLADQRRQQIQSLEAKIKELHVEKREKEKLVRIKVQNDKKIVQMNGDIKSLKQNRVKLMRQMKEESSRHMNWKRQKENEVRQLQKKDRKRQAELSKLEMNMKRQKAVMMRKTEKTEAELKRFKELLLRTKQNNIRRTIAPTGNKKEHELVKWKDWMSSQCQIRYHLQEAKKCQANIEQDLQKLRTEMEAFNQNDHKSKRRRTLTSWELNANVEKVTELQEQVKIKEELLSKFKDQIQDGKKALQQYDSQLVNLNSLKDSRDVVKYLLNHMFDKKVSEAAEVEKLHEDNEQMLMLKEELNSLKNIKMKQDQENNDKILSLTKELVRKTDVSITTSKNNSEIEQLREQLKMQATCINNLESDKNKLEVQLKNVEKRRTFKKPQKSKKTKVQTIYEDDVFEETDEDEVVAREDDDSDYVPTPIKRKLERLENKNKRRTQVLQKKKKSPKSTPDTAKEVLETTEVVPETPQEAACVRSSGDGVDTPKLDLNGTFEVASNLQQTMLDPSTPVTYEPIPMETENNIGVTTTPKQNRIPTTELKHDSSYKPVLFDSPVDFQETKKVGRHVQRNTRKFKLHNPSDNQHF